MKRAARGFTLIEIMVVLAIVSLFLTGVIVSARSLAKTDLRSSSSQMASGIRYLFDRARSTGKYYRLVIDLDAGRYWAEVSDDRFLMLREKESSTRRGRGPDEEEEKQKEEAKQKQLAATQPTTGPDTSELFDDRGNLKLGQPKAVFKSFKDTTLKPVEIKKGVKIADVYTPRQRDAYTEGRAYLYFFPQGFGERAVIHLSDGKDSFYSLIVHPLTGRVQIAGGYVDVPRDFDRRDDQGNMMRER